MKVLVTGGKGFTGRYVQASLEARGHEVVAPYFDLTDAAHVDEQISGVRPEAVIHLAARAFVHSDDLASFYTVNQLGTFNLLRSLAKHSPGIHVLLASSATVYGSNASGTVSEACVPAPNSHYGISKLAMEFGAALWRDTLSISIVRPFNYTGVGQDSSFLIPKVVDHFRRRMPSISLGNLQPARDFGDVRIVADAYADLVTGEPVDGVVNLCTGVGHSVGDIIDIATRLSGHKPEIVVNPAFVRANDIPYLVGDPTRLKTLLPSWEPRPLEQTIAWMLDANDGVSGA